MVSQPKYSIELERFATLKTSDRSGCLYKVFFADRVIGTYYQKKGKWLANTIPSHLTIANRSIEAKFNSNEKAIAHIIRNHRQIGK